MPLTLVKLASKIDTTEKQVKFLQKYKMLPVNQKCPSCQKVLTNLEYRNRTARFRCYCSKGKSVSIREAIKIETKYGTFFTFPYFMYFLMESLVINNNSSYHSDSFLGALVTHRARAVVGQHQGANTFSLQAWLNILTRNTKFYQIIRGLMAEVLKKKKQKEKKLEYKAKP